MARAAWVVIILVMAGCAAQPPVEDATEPVPEDLPDALDDRGPQLPNDIAAPPPSDAYDEIAPVEPTADEPESPPEGHDDDSQPGEDGPPGAEQPRGEESDTSTIPYRVVGTVLAHGAPRQAMVGVESVNLRDPVNNIDAYVKTWQATAVQTSSDGRYAFDMEGAFYHVRADAAGFLPTRVRPQPSPDGSVTVDIELRPAVGPVVVAHRGASFYAPENTLAAFQKATLLGASAIELDVGLTADGVLAVIHDGTLDRTTTASGHLHQTEWSAMKDADAGAWFHSSFRGQQVPTLQQALDATAASGADVFIDMKAGRDRIGLLATAVLDLVKDPAYRDRTIVMSSSNDTVAQCAAAGHPRCAYVTQGWRPATQTVDVLIANGGTVLTLNQAHATMDLVRYAADRGVVVYSWTANHAHEWHRLEQAGVAGIITDRPGYLLDYLAR